MANQDTFPKTLQAAIQYFSDEQRCIDFLADIRWPDGNAVCANCDDKEQTYYLANQKRWKCRSCKKQFSVKVGTIFEESPLALSTWFPAMWLICGAKNGISSCEIARALGVTQKTAWFMMHRIRLAMNQGTFEKMSGEVEVDETYIGGASRFMHADRRKKGMVGSAGKVAVFGLLERHGEEKKSRVRTKVVSGTTSDILQGEIHSNVQQGSKIYSDEHGAYRSLGENGDYFHAFVKHAEFYVNGSVHTNGIENFWTLLKRSIKGTYVSVEPFHMFRYLDEQSFRFNARFGDDADRFIAAINEATGKRVTYKKLTGKEETAKPSGRDAASDDMIAS